MLCASIYIAKVNIFFCVAKKKNNLFFYLSCSMSYKWYIDFGIAFDLIEFTFPVSLDI